MSFLFYQFLPHSLLHKQVLVHCGKNAKHQKSQQLLRLQSK